MAAYRYKTACVDVEQIRSTDAVVSGMFASYHVYPYFPDYLELMRELSAYSDEEITERLGSTNRPCWNTASPFWRPPPLRSICSRRITMTPGETTTPIWPI